MITELLTLAHLERCFGGAVPAVLATASADGIPNVTYISRAHQVDGERIALSNQFMSKTARNLAANPRATLLLLDPQSYDEFRLTLVYERTERRGHVFERLRTDIDLLAQLEGMQDVYRLRAADVFRVVDITQIPPNPSARVPDDVIAPRTVADVGALGALAATLARAGDLDVLVGTALEGLDRHLGYRHTNLLLLDEDGRRLYTIASRGFDTEGIGSEVAVGEGHIGIAAERCETIRIGGLQQAAKYSRSIRRSYEDVGVGSGGDVPLPGVDGVESRIVVPLMALGQLVGVLVAESRQRAAFTTADEQLLGTVATMLASSIEAIRSLDNHADPAPAPSRSMPTTPAATAAPAAGAAVAVRYFDVDGSVFIAGDYLIKGVAGRILWALLRAHAADGRTDFTNRELRLDPTLDLPGIKDNLESRLILLKRRLDERGTPVRIEKTGRGRFRLLVDRPVELAD